MPTRKDLKGISAGIAYSFSSRNNDIDGYWAMGILYKVASEAGTKKFKLNLLSGESDPSFKYSRKVASPYQVYLTDQIDKNCDTLNISQLDIIQFHPIHHIISNTCSINYLDN